MLQWSCQDKVVTATNIPNSGPLVKTKIKFFCPPGAERERRMEKVKIGLIGCGKMMASHLKGIHQVENAQVVAVCDNLPDNARAVAESLAQE